MSSRPQKYPWTVLLITVEKSRSFGVQRYLRSSAFFLFFCCRLDKGYKFLLLSPPSTLVCIIPYNVYMNVSKFNIWVHILVDTYIHSGSANNNYFTEV
jgi:hypothetical protein